MLARIAAAVALILALLLGEHTLTPWVIGLLEGATGTEFRRDTGKDTGRDIRQWFLNKRADFYYVKPLRDGGRSPLGNE